LPTVSSIELRKKFIQLQDKNSALNKKSTRHDLMEAEMTMLDDKLDNGHLEKRRKLKTVRKSRNDLDDEQYKIQERFEHYLDKKKSVKRPNKGHDSTSSEEICITGDNSNSMVGKMIGQPIGEIPRP
jgi:hypothetical protein